MRAGAVDPAAHSSPSIHIGGSWTSTCKLLSFMKSFLSALCTTSANMSNNSTFLPGGGSHSGPNMTVNAYVNVSLCGPGATLSAPWGVLVCSSASTSLPGGPWVASCGPQLWDGRWLAAYCISPSGLGAVHSAVDTYTCTGAHNMVNVSTSTGKLQCQS